MKFYKSSFFHCHSSILIYSSCIKVLFTLLSHISPQCDWNSKEQIINPRLPVYVQVICAFFFTTSSSLGLFGLLFEGPALTIHTSWLKGCVGKLSFLFRIIFLRVFSSCSLIQIHFFILLYVYICSISSSFGFIVMFRLIFLSYNYLLLFIFIFIFLDFTLFCIFRLYCMYFWHVSQWLQRKHTLIIYFLVLILIIIPMKKRNKIFIFYETNRMIILGLS